MVDPLGDCAPRLSVRSVVRVWPACQNDIISSQVTYFPGKCATACSVVRATALSALSPCLLCVPCPATPVPPNHGLFGLPRVMGSVVQPGECQDVVS